MIENMVYSENIDEPAPLLSEYLTSPQHFQEVQNVD